MSKRNLQPSDLDRLGKTLIANDAMSEAEIENIVNAPFLYSGVRSRILSDAATAGPRFGLARYFVFAGSSLAVVFSILATISFFRIEQRQVSNVEPPKVVEIKSSHVPDSIAESSQKPLPIDPLIDRVNSKRRVSQQAQSISYRKEEGRMPQMQKAQQPALEFYPVSYTGDPNDTAGGRVVRVEMSRASLFAMGINIPIENGAEVIKADLLIGPDGVTRAVRLAKDF
ncbi:MAG: hypothetical protein ACJ72Z_02045 [Pyrinomonadaceae bacterium]